MKRFLLLLLSVLAIAAACGGTAGNDNADTSDNRSAPISDTQPSNDEILKLAYDLDYHVPDDFFVDERAETTTRSYTVHHVLDESGSFELCTDDLVEAQTWEQADNESRSVSGQFVSTYENERYFEIVRELSFDQDIGNIGDPTSPGYARVFKCAHTNRDGVDRSLLNGYSGTINTETLDDQELKEFTEYLWQFQFFNVRRKLVVDSYSAPGMSHTLLLALVINQGTGNCDRVDVVEWRFTGNPSNGQIDRIFEAIRGFTATFENGVAEFC